MGGLGAWISTLERLAMRGDSSPKACGVRLRAVMAVADISRAELGDLAGVVPSAVGNSLSGISRPGVKVLAVLRRGFGVTADFVLLGEVDHLPIGLQEQLLAALERIAKRSSLPERGPRKDPLHD